MCLFASKKETFLWIMPLWTTLAMHGEKEETPFPNYDHSRPSKKTIFYFHFFSSARQRRRHYANSGIKHAICKGEYQFPIMIIVDSAREINFLDRGVGSSPYKAA